MLGRSGNLLTRNEYIYVLNNPLKYVDPSGETTVERQRELGLTQADWLLSIEYKTADVLEQIKNYNYENGDWAAKAGGFLLGTLGDSIRNLAKATDSNVTGGGKSMAKAMVILDVGTFGRGAAAKTIVKESSNVVYRGLNEVGDTVYIGITNNFERRAIQHGERFSGMEIIEGAVDLTRTQARGIEQAIIETANKTGIILENKINSIALNNSIYSQAVDFGKSFIQNLNLFK